MLNLTLALLLATQTQPVAPNTSEDIVVTGQRPLDRDSARRYVNDISRPIRGQLATFRHPVCPSVVGLDPQYSAVIVDRIREIAGQAKMRVDQPACAPNVTLVVVDSSEELVKQLYRSHALFFAGLERHDVRRLIKADGPVRAWSVVQVQNEDGQGASGKSIRIMMPSIIKSPTRQTVIASFVAIDTTALFGKNLTQIADYVAMRALAGAEPPEEDAVGDTILTLFDTDAPKAPSLSASDLAYMAALHRMPHQKLGVQRGRLSRAVVKATAETPEPRL